MEVDTPPIHEQLPSPAPLHEVQKNALRPEVHAYATNLESQIATIIASYHQPDLASFFYYARTNAINRADLDHIQDMLIRLQTVSETGTMSRPIDFVAEKKRLDAFFGKDIEVPRPPTSLFLTMERAEALGWTGLEPHYLPELNIATWNERGAPGRIPLNETFWQYLSGGSVSLPMDAVLLHAGWFLMDGRPKPEELEEYENDFLASELQHLRGEGKIPNPRANTAFHPRPNNPFSGTRAELAWTDINQYVLPWIKDSLQLDSNRAEVRLPRAIEWNVSGNIFHPEWGTTNMDEWLHDPVSVPERVSYRLKGGDVKEGGLSYITMRHQINGSNRIGFRPYIFFTN